jgi:hypothetical protein
MARYRGISQIWLFFRVRNLAMEAPFLSPVSEGFFSCLVFDVCWSRQLVPSRAELRQARATPSAK